MTYWAWQSGNQGSVTFGGYYCSTVTHAKAFQGRRGWHVDVAGIRRGDIVFFDWNHTNSLPAIDHVGVVTGVSGGKVLTIEGNTEHTCARRARTAREIVGYGRPSYSGTPSPPPRPPSYEPFPGAGLFSKGRRSPIIAAMHRRLVVVGCNHYQSTQNIDVWGSGDVASYAAWQRKCGYSGRDADGIPGKTSWDRLHVPNV